MLSATGYLYQSEHKIVYWFRHYRGNETWKRWYLTPTIWLFYEQTSPLTPLNFYKNLLKILMKYSISTQIFRLRFQKIENMIIYTIKNQIYLKEYMLQFIFFLITFYHHNIFLNKLKVIFLWKVLYLFDCSFDFSERVDSASL